MSNYLLRWYSNGDHAEETFTDQAAVLARISELAVSGKECRLYEEIPVKLRVTASLPRRYRNGSPAGSPTIAQYPPGVPAAEPAGDILEALPDGGWIDPEREAQICQCNHPRSEHAGGTTFCSTVEGSQNCFCLRFVPEKNPTSPQSPGQQVVGDEEGATSEQSAGVATAEGPPPGSAPALAEQDRQVEPVGRRGSGEGGPPTPPAAANEDGALPASWGRVTADGERAAWHLWWMGNAEAVCSEVTDSLVLHSAPTDPAMVCLDCAESSHPMAVAYQEQRAEEERQQKEPQREFSISLDKSQPGGVRVEPVSKPKRNVPERCVVTGCSEKGSSRNQWCCVGHARTFDLQERQRLLATWKRVQKSAPAKALNEPQGMGPAATEE